MSQKSNGINGSLTGTYPSSVGNAKQPAQKVSFPDPGSSPSNGPSPSSSTADLATTHPNGRRSVDATSSTSDDAAVDVPPSVLDTQLTLRALVSTKEAGVIIGKGGKNVADLRETANVRAGVSKVVPGIHDRVLSVTGILDHVGHAYELVAQTLIDNHLAVIGHNAMQSGSSPLYTVVRILISHNLMGSIIGRQGTKIKHMQDITGARLVATKEMLPQSTERVVEIHGDVESIRAAVEEIGKCLIQDWERGVGAVLYNPSTQTPAMSTSANPYVNNTRTSFDFINSDVDRVMAAAVASNGALSTSSVAAMAALHRHRSHTVSVTRTSHPMDYLGSSMPVPPRHQQHQNTANVNSNAAAAFSTPRRDSGSITPPGYISGVSAIAKNSTANARLRSQSVSIQGQRGADTASAIMANICTQEITIPCDMVGCIIGKNGSRISEIRRLSGSRISIARASESEGGERLFTISGTPECNERALYLLYGQLEAERERRMANARMATANLEAINEGTVAEEE